MNTLYSQLSTSQNEVFVYSSYLLGENLIIDSQLETTIFWNETNRWLSSASAWNNIIIDGVKVPKSTIFFLAKLNLPITPSYVPALVNSDALSSFNEHLDFKSNPVVLAIHLGDVELVENLLLDGTSANFVSQVQLIDVIKDCSLLDIAIACNQVQIIQLLIDYGADLNKALLGAIENENYEIIHMLLKRGAKPIESNKIIKAVLYLENSTSTLIVKLLLEHGISLIPETHDNALLLLEKIIYTDNIENFQLFATQMRDQHPNCLLICLYNLLLADNPSAEKWIRTLIMILDAKTLNATLNELPLLHLVARRSEELALLVLERGADPNNMTNTQITALHLAAILNFQCLTSSLLSKGADLSIRDYTGATALNHSLNYLKTLPLAQQLLENGALETADKYLLYDSSKSLRIKWLFKAPKTSAEHILWRKINVTKCCSHLFDLEGMSAVRFNKYDNPILRFYREGMLTPITFIKKIGNYTKNMVGLEPTLIATLHSMCEFTAKEHLRSSVDYLDKIRKNEPVLIMTSSARHCYYILFYKNAYVVCDGNAVNIEIQRYDPQLLTEELIDTIRYGSSYADSLEYVNSLLDSVEQAIDVRHEEADWVNYQSNLWECQTKGTCTWKSFEFAIHALILLEGFSLTPFLPLWILRLKLDFASEYMEIHTQDATFQPEFSLVYTMLAQLEEQKDNFTDEMREKFDHLFAWKNQLAVDEALETVDPEHESNCDACFSHFIYHELKENEWYYDNILRW